MNQQSLSQPYLPDNIPERNRRTMSDTDIDIGEWGQFVDLEGRNLYGKRKFVKYQGGYMRTYVEFTPNRNKRWYLDSYRYPIVSLLNYFMSTKPKDFTDKHVCGTIKEESSELNLMDLMDNKDDKYVPSTESVGTRKGPSYIDAFPFHIGNTSYIIVVTVIATAAFMMCFL